ncbi:methyltransferase domain-containing protein [Salinibacter sp.]|uniref:methyltransferase domain-containing protein n=1 Tax=Salinibacter sp. TaxID=2065818 RepID=UPI00234B6CD7
MPDAVLTDEERVQQDDRPDRAFYREPRLVQHVDEQFRECLTDLYRRQLGAGDEVLDLMSSWVSHLPDELELGRVAGHGMNEEELAANERLTESFVQDLNETPDLPLETGAFDAALCAVSVQYLRHPEQVFAEVARVLRPGGLFVMSFSNRMFAQKAIRAWRTASGPGRLQLVRQYFEAVEAFRGPTTISENPFVPPTRRFLGGAPDPFYAAHARTQE